MTHAVYTLVNDIWILVLALRKTADVSSDCWVAVMKLILNCMTAESMRVTIIKWPEYKQELIMAQDSKGKTSLHHASQSGPIDAWDFILDSVPLESRYQILLVKDSDGRGGGCLCISQLT